MKLGIGTSGDSEAKALLYAENGRQNDTAHTDQVTSKSDTNDDAILAALGISRVEYEAMICPYYGVPLPPRKMASWTVLEQRVAPVLEPTAAQTQEVFVA